MEMTDVGLEGDIRTELNVVILVRYGDVVSGSSDGLKKEKKEVG